MTYVDSRLEMQDFNPRSSCEERHDNSSSLDYPLHFNPRSSCEERPISELSVSSLFEFQSTLLMRGATS